MLSYLYPLLCLLCERFNRRRDAEIRFLREENKMLRARIQTQRIILSPRERSRLLRIGKVFRHQVEHLISIVQFRTYKRWLKEQVEGVQPGQVGRKSKITKELRQLIIDMALGNELWGSQRISGELFTVAISVSKTTIRRILAQCGIYPEPDKGRRKRSISDSTWENFIKLHINTLVACDFFCKTIWTPFGRKSAYCLAFIHLGTRKVFLSPSTYNPKEEWVKQQARNLLMWLEDHKLTAGYLIRDRDCKFSPSFDRLLKNAGVQVRKSPPRSPNFNAFCEAWIGSLKRECLNWFMCFSLKHLDYITNEYVHFYNIHRPHQSMGNRTLTFGKRSKPKLRSHEDPVGKIACDEHLGGLLKRYRRAAA